MSEQIKEILGCTFCPFLEDDRVIGHWCGQMPGNTRIPNQYKPPDWCPLRAGVLLKLTEEDYWDKKRKAEGKDNSK